MDKISGILPSTARIESVDMREERPLRSGALSFGQPVLKATERMSAAPKEIVSTLSHDEASRELRNPGRKSDTDIATELSSAFFLKNRDNGRPNSSSSDSATSTLKDSKNLSIYA